MTTVWGATPVTETKDYTTAAASQSLLVATVMQGATPEAEEEEQGSRNEGRGRHEAPTGAGSHGQSVRTGAEEQVSGVLVHEFVVVS